MNSTINISLKDFVLTGIFDVIKPGQTKDWVLNNFILPDDDTDCCNQLSILRYDWLEFHFDKGILFTIWCDYLDYLHSGKKIFFSKWFSQTLSSVTLSEMQQELNNLKINYITKHNDKLKNVQIKVVKSNVVLWFEGDEDDTSNIEKYTFFAFGSSDPEYDSFERDLF